MVLVLLGWTQRTILLGEGVVGATVGSLASGAIVSSIRIGWGREAEAFGWGSVNVVLELYSLYAARGEA